MAKDSRLRRRQENETRTYLFLTISGVIIFVLLLIFFGIPLLIQFSLFATHIAGKQSQTDNAVETVLVSPPQLSLPYEATNSAEISIVGSAGKDQKVKLYVNDEVKGETDVTDDESFKFTSVNLDPGENTIEAVAITKDNKKSRMSDPISVSYIKEPPQLEIAAPSDNQELHGSENNPTTVRGKTEPNASVTVNGFFAITDSSGNYHYNLSLHEGDNTIHVTATDPAGNKTDKEVKVKFIP